MIGTVMSHGSAAPSSSTESVMLPSFPRFGPETPDPQNGNKKKLQIDSTRSIHSTKSTRSDGKVYPFDCASYNPLVAVAATVEHILHRRLSYCEDAKDIHYFQVKDGQGRHHVNAWDTLDEKARAIVLYTSCLSINSRFLQWRTIPSDALSLSSDSFRNLLIECDVNPLFIDMLGYPNTGGAGSSVTYHGENRDAFHVYIRYPHTYPEYECARYLRYSFSNNQTVVISMEGHGTVSSRAEYVFDQLLQGKQQEPQNPFSYLIPFIVQMGHAMDHLRAKQRDEVIFIEKSTDTGEVDPFQAGARNLDNITHLTRLAHLRSASTARLMKLLKFHIRAVREVIKGFQKFEKIDKGEQRGCLKTLIESERLEDILEQELDLCMGRSMETENLVKRTDIQINVLISLAAQKDSNVNKRIAEQSKQIALETRRDSEAMKTIAVLTMLFLPGTFVSTFLGMNFFDGENGHFSSDGRWWIFLAVSIPLTLIVVGSWFSWIFWKQRQAEGNGYNGKIDESNNEILAGREGDTRGIASATGIAG